VWGVAAGSATILVWSFVGSGGRKEGFGPGAPPGGAARLGPPAPWPETARGPSLPPPRARRQRRPARPAAVLYHEASKPEALGLTPYGRCIRNANRTKFRSDPNAPPGPDFAVMASRGRPHPATSAVDVVVEPGREVFAPVTGTVVGLRRYVLYGAYEDARIAIRPEDAPSTIVVMIHVDAVGVAKGQRVVASITPLGQARHFPFRSQVDDYVRGEYPHVHMEVKHAP
jgi:hypothetical protein